MLDQAGTKSTISQDQGKKYGQADLTDAELDRLQDRPGWSWSPHGFHAQVAKALLQEEGETLWLDYYDHTIGVDEHLSVIKSSVDMAVEEGLSGSGEGRDDVGKTTEEIARDLDEGYSRMCRRAKDACSEGSNSGLGPAGWQDFATNIIDSSLDSPKSLLELEPEEWPTDIWTSQANREWVTQRLSRSTRLAMTLEDLNNRGIWVTTLYEPSYPSHLADTLDRKAPPFLYVAGEEDNLKATAVGFVGSRDADETDRGYTQRLVEKVIDDGFGVVSGGAKGIDETSEQTGLERGGPVIEFPAEGIHHCLRDETIRDAVMEGQLTLASPYHPRTSWNVGAAMGRNKLIHSFGKYTIVVRSGNETGGTWDGSIENLEHEWSPLLICSHDTLTGNKALIKKGGIPIDPTAIPEEDSLDRWVRAQQQSVSDSMGQDEQSARAVDESGASEDTQSSLNNFE